MATVYKYFGILIGDATPDRPSGVIRVWTDADGRQREETYAPSLTWEPSRHLASNARPTFDEIVEVDQSVLGPFIERVKRLHGKS